MPDAAPDVILREVGPRDGLQSVPRFIPTRLKARIVEELEAAGIAEIQVASFVSPRKLPQMADAEALMALLPPPGRVRRVGLALSLSGARRAADAGLAELEAGVSASLAHGLKNVGRDTDEALQDCEKIARLARERGMRLWLNIQCAFGYARPGDVARSSVVEIARKMMEWGPDFLVPADTTGLARPDDVRALLSELAPIAAMERIALHLHDAYGLAFANLEAALEMGVRRFDTAFGGLGGCPFAPKAPGNLSTEATVRRLAARGLTTFIDAGKVSAVTRLLQRDGGFARGGGGETFYE